MRWTWWDSEYGDGGSLEPRGIPIELQLYVIEDEAHWIWLESQEGRVVLVPDVGEV